MDLKKQIEKNRFDYTGENLKRGLRAEEKFKQLALSKGFKVKPANRQQDIDEHWDFKLIKGEKSIKVEVKAMKKIKRTDSSPQDKYTWIEIHGVKENDKGWLFQGKSDYIAFETKQSFILVSRNKLIEYIKPRFSNIFVENSEDALKKDKEGKYLRYRRKNRNDELILIEVEILRELADEERFFE